MSIHSFEIKSLGLLQQRWKTRNVLRLHYLLKYAIISVNNENIKQWRKCAVWFFLFLSTISHKKWHKDEFETYQHTCNFSDKICPLLYHRHIKRGLKCFLGGEVLLVVRQVPYQTLHLKMLAIIVMIKEMLILLTQKYFCLRKASGIKQR